MTNNHKTYSRIHLSTDPFPENQRLQAWQDLYCNGWRPCDITSSSDHALRASATFHLLPEIRVGVASMTAHHARVTRRHIGNMDASITLIGKLTPSRTVYREKRLELHPKAGEFFIHRADVPYSYSNTDAGEYVGISFSAGILHRLAPGFRLQEARILPCTPYFGYLIDYIRRLQLRPGIPDDLAYAIATHLKDLIALTLGSTRDIEHQAQGRGLMAARLEAVKDYVRRNLLDARLSDVTVARHLGVSARYVRKLFTMDDSGGITRYITGQRLEAAYRQLTVAPGSRIKIIDLALSCCFNDVSTFNRLFKARFGMTPSEARHKAGSTRNE